MGGKYICTVIPTEPFSPKLASALPESWQTALHPEDADLLRRLESGLGFSFQQLRTAASWMLDARMWEELSVREILSRELSAWETLPEQGRNGPQARDRIFAAGREAHALLTARPKQFKPAPEPERLPTLRYEEQELKGRIFKLCPAASERAVCCNLQVLNVTANCAMACSYCVLQTHYEEPVVSLPSNLKAKLAEIRLNPERRYRISTGEYSDSLLVGNRNNILGDLCDFARAHPNAVIEFKTKTANVGWMLLNPIPANVCCSWSLNPQLVIENEEHRTASLSKRLDAARAAADRGIRVGFHLHPMMWYEGWEEQYAALIGELIRRFDPGEVLWVSLGTVTLLKGFVQDFRGKYSHSKLLQMDLEETPDGKLTYPFDVREALYRNALSALEPWKGKVFQYMCMEHRPMWEAVMGFAYPNMGEFDAVFNDSVFPKLARPPV
jgi:spore photoproduct lyase